MGITKTEFETLLDEVTAVLRGEARGTPFTTAKQFENRVREVVKDTLNDPAIDKCDPIAI